MPQTLSRNIAAPDYDYDSHISSIDTQYCCMALSAGPASRSWLGLQTVDRRRPLNEGEQRGSWSGRDLRDRFCTTSGPLDIIT